MKLFFIDIWVHTTPMKLLRFLLSFDRHLFDSINSDYHVLSTDLFACN